MRDTFLYGVCYYPEHWDVARHASDIQRMAGCGFNVVRLGEGAWSYWEPEEGRFQFELFDRVIDLCRKNGIRIIMGTPTYCAPAWVARKYPEVLRWNFERIPMQHGSRRHFNYTSPKYLDLSDRICTALAEHYRNEKQIIAWQLDNEFNCHMDASYAPSDTIAFREWLKKKYRTIDRFNEAWGSRFWSQTYDTFEQVDLPHPTVTWANPSQLLDETRFISDCVVAFAGRQAEILRRANASWRITHNGLFTNIDGRALASKLDFFSHDQYPLFSKEGAWWEYAQGLVTARSLSFPFGVMEQQSGPGGQMGYLQRTPRPGEMRLWAWQSIAHGADLLSFFRWRTCPYGAEQHWHGLLDADDQDNRRIAEAKQLGTELRKLPEDFFNARPSRGVAVLRDFDNETNDRRINTYTRSGQGEAARWLCEFARRHIAADVVWPTSDLDGYRILIAPHLKLATRPLVAAMTQFVEAGGVLVLSAQSGLKDANCHIVEATPPGLFRRLAGVRVEDWTTLGDDETRVARLPSGWPVYLNTFVERLQPATAETVAAWTSGDVLLDGGAAITRNKIGKGVVYYVGGYAPDGAVATLAEWLAREHGLSPIVHAGPEVEAIARGPADRIVALLNHGPSDQRVRGVAGKDLLSGKAVEEKAGLLLGPYGVAIIDRQAAARGKAVTKRQLKATRGTAPPRRRATRRAARA